MVVHAARQPGAVVNEVELASERPWIGGAGLLGQVGEHGPDPRPELVGGVLDEAALGASVEAAMNAQPWKSGCSYCCAWVAKTARIFCRGSSNWSMAAVSLLVVASCREAR